jgi:hypothetical protein
MQAPAHIQVDGRLGGPVQGKDLAVVQVQDEQVSVPPRQLVQLHAIALAVAGGGEEAGQ